jgi:hypothetical protein
MSDIGDAPDASFLENPFGDLLGEMRIARGLLANWIERVS